MKPATRTNRNGSASPSATTTPTALRSLAPGVSLGELARRTGITRPHLSRLFSGQRTLTVNKARRIAKALDVSLVRLLDLVSPASQ